MVSMSTPWYLCVHQGFATIEQGARVQLLGCVSPERNERAQQIFRQELNITRMASLLSLHMTAVRFSRQNRLVGNRLPRLPRGKTVPAVVTDCLTCELRILRQFIFLLTTVLRVLWLYLYSKDIGAGPDAKFSLFRLTVGKLWPCLCCLFGQKRLLFSYIALSTSFLSLKRKNLFIWPWNELKSRCQRAI